MGKNQNIMLARPLRHEIETAWAKALRPVLEVYVRENRPMPATDKNGQLIWIAPTKVAKQLAQSPN